MPSRIRDITSHYYLSSTSRSKVVKSSWHEREEKKDTRYSKVFGISSHYSIRFFIFQRELPARHDGGRSRSFIARDGFP